MLLSKFFTLKSVALMCVNFEMTVLSEPANPETEPATDEPEIALRISQADAEQLGVTITDGVQLQD